MTGGVDAAGGAVTGADGAMTVGPDSAAGAHPASRPTAAAKTAIRPAVRPIVRCIATSPEMCFPTQSA
jgi:hypothetical protein